MAYQVDTDTAAHTEIGTKLAALLNAATITTLHGMGTQKIGNDRYLIWIAYE